MGLIVKDMCVELQNAKILREVSLAIEDGALISLLGASGCGKSTFLKSIAGLLELKQGEVTVNGTVVTHLPPEKRGTVIVFQDLRLFPHMTVGQNVAFPMDLQKVAKEQQRQTVSELLAAVRLSGFEKRKVRELSGGQRQRIALARALAARPKVLLLDEPFSSLHDSLRVEMGSLVKQLHKEYNLTTILVTHDRQEALTMSDKIALMKEGRIRQYDTPEMILGSPADQDVAEYFGKITYIEGTVKDQVFQGEEFRAETARPDGSYVAAVLSDVCYFKKEKPDEKDHS